MLTILLRTLIIYLTLVVTMRVMGKRQLGELEVSELVTTLLLSEVASLPITNQDIPLAFAIVPVLTLMSLEVLLSGLLLHIPALPAQAPYGSCVPARKWLPCYYINHR